MRVTVGKPVKVGPGDEVIVRGQLPPGSRLGRLYVFASEGGRQFSPYVQNIRDMVDDGKGPPMLTPMSLRLVETRPEGKISFVADIDGRICVMEEVDNEIAPRSKVTIRRRINPALPWTQRLTRQLSAVFS